MPFVSTHNLIILTVLTLIMILLILYVFFASKTCGFKNITKVARLLMFGGYVIFFITILYSLIKAISYGHITINNITLAVLVGAILISLIGVITNMVSKYNK